MGTFDKAYALAAAGTGEHRAYLDPETLTAQTPLGTHQRVTERVRMLAAPGHYRIPLVARGSCRPEWQPRVQ